MVKVLQADSLLLKKVNRKNHRSEEKFSLFVAPGMWHGII